MPRIVESDAQARQGPSGRPVLMVLIGAFALIGLYLLSMLFWAGSTSPDSTSQDASRTAVTGSPSGSANPTDPDPAGQSRLPVAQRHDDGLDDAIRHNGQLPASTEERVARRYRGRNKGRPSRPFLCGGRSAARVSASKRR